METSTPTNLLATTDRFLRQRDLVSTESLAETPVSIIGVGAIGRQVALQLAALGVMQIQLIDFDCVEAHNVTNQGYRMQDVGLLKVDAAKSAIAEIDSAIKVEVVQDRFRTRQSTRPCRFSAASIRSKAGQRSGGILNGVPSFWADGRMMGEVMRILTASCGVSRESYGRTLFSPSEAQTGSCTSTQHHLHRKTSRRR